MSKKPKLYKSKRDPELYYYFSAKNEKRWMYRHRYYDALGKRREKSKQGFTSENEAYRQLLEVKTSILNGDIKEVQNSDITVSEWLDIWYETYNTDWEVTTRIQRKQTIDEIIVPRLGRYKLSKLDKTTYRRVFVNDLLKTHKPSSVKQYHSRFMVAVNAAVDDDILPKNKLNNMKIVDEEPLSNFLAPHELSIFLDMVKKQNNITSYTLILLLAYSGLRQGEAFGLKWKNINFKEKTITVELTRDNNGARSPKTKNSYRTIGVDDIVIHQLKLYQKWCIEKKFEYGQQLDKRNDYVFISRNGAKPSSYIVLHHAFKKVYEQCEKEGIVLKKITPHGLRHTHATILINNGVPPKVVADRLGNSIKVVLNVYSHSLREIQDKAISIFSESLSKVGGGFGGS